MRHIRTTLLATTAVAATAAVAAACTSAGTAAQPPDRDQHGQHDVGAGRTAGPPGRGDLPRRAEPDGDHPARPRGHPDAAPPHAPGRLHAERPRRGRADRDAAQPHRHGHRPTHREGRTTATPSPGTTSASSRPRCRRPPSTASTRSSPSPTARDSRSALYSAKEKFSLFQRSWPSGTNKVLIDANNHTLAAEAVSDLEDESFDFAFLHISLPDRAGHAHGWLSERYLTAVRQSDALVGDVVSTIRADDAARRPRHRHPHRRPRRAPRRAQPHRGRPAGELPRPVPHVGRRRRARRRPLRPQPGPGRPGHARGSATARRGSRSATPTSRTRPPRSSGSRPCAGAGSTPTASSTGADPPPPPLPARRHSGTAETSLRYARDVTPVRARRHSVRPRRHSGARGRRPDADPRRSAAGAPGIAYAVTLA